MAELSLKELKAENGSGSEETQDEPIEQQQEELQDDYVEVDENLEPVEEESKDDEEVTKDKPDTEAWMQTDEATSDENTGFVPNHEAAKHRKKAKALRGAVEEKNSEIEELKSQIAALQSGTQVIKPEVEELKPPELPEDLYDEDAMRKYHQETAKYQQELVNTSEQRRQSQLQKQQQEQQVEEQKKALSKRLDSHYERAAKLIDDGKISADAYKQADSNVRHSLNLVSQGNGDVLTDRLIATLDSLGEGSEKVMYMLGVNSNKMSMLSSKLSEDPSGLSASVYLGTLLTEVSTPSKKRSNAPKPTKKVEGDTNASSQGDKLKRKYQKMTDVQERISFKRKARQDGHNVDNW